MNQNWIQGLFLVPFTKGRPYSHQKDMNNYYRRSPVIGHQKIQLDVVHQMRVGRKVNYMSGKI